MGLPTNPKAHARELVRRNSYQEGVAEFTLVGIGGPACLLGNRESLPCTWRKDGSSEADGYESFLLGVLEQEFERAEARGEARAYNKALKLLEGAVGDRDGTSSAIYELQAKLVEALGKDVYHVNVDKSLPNEMRVDLIKSMEQEYGVGRVRIRVIS